MMHHTWAFNAYSEQCLLKRFLLKTRTWCSNISTRTSRVARKFLLQIHWMIRNKMYESDFLWEHFHFFWSIVQKTYDSLICSNNNLKCFINNDRLYVSIYPIMHKNLSCSYFVFRVENLAQCFLLCNAVHSILLRTSWSNAERRSWRNLSLKKYQMII
jgi:hypothetical protein